jgi:hypothetical protein
MDLKQTVNKVLEESLDRPYTWKLAANEPIFILAVFNTKSDKITVRFNKGWSNGHTNWYVDFEGQYNHDATGLGDEFRVFATVIDVMRWFIKEKSPPCFSFTAEKDPTRSGDSRSKLYDRLIKRFARDIKYKVNSYSGADEKEYEFEANNP